VDWRKEWFALASGLAVVTLLGACLTGLVAVTLVGAGLLLERAVDDQVPDCPWTVTQFERDYRHHVHAGMMLEEVEAVLGKGEHRPNGMREHRGKSGDGNWRETAVEGDTEFYAWQRGPMRIWVGFRDGKVVHKCLDAPSSS
jgi:hypothetical protein